jgi:hypothetical protein
LLHILEIQTLAVVHKVRDFKLESKESIQISPAGSAALAANVPVTGLALLILAKQSMV